MLLSESLSSTSSKLLSSLETGYESHLSLNRLDGPSVSEVSSNGFLPPANSTVTMNTSESEASQSET